MKKSEILDLIGGILVCSAILLPILHWSLWSFDVGVPRNRDVLRMQISTPNSLSLGIEIYGDSYTISQDNFDNTIVIVSNPYEAGWFGWRNHKDTASFYGEITSIRHYNLNYYNKY